MNILSLKQLKLFHSILCMLISTIICIYIYINIAHAVPAISEYDPINYAWPNRYPNVWL